MTTNTLRTLKANDVLLDERNETLWRVEKKQTKDRIVIVSNRINANEKHPVPYDVIKAHYVALTNVATLTATDSKKTDSKRQKKMTFDEMLSLIEANEAIECKRMKSDTLAVKHNNKRLFRITGRTADNKFRLITDRATLFEIFDDAVIKTDKKGAYAILITDDVNAVINRLLAQ